MRGDVVVRLSATAAVPAASGTAIRVTEPAATRCADGVDGLADERAVERGAGGVEVDRVVRDPGPVGGRRPVDERQVRMPFDRPLEMLVHGREVPVVRLDLVPRARRDVLRLHLAQRHPEHVLHAAFLERPDDRVDRAVEPSGVPVRVVVAAGDRRRSRRAATGARRGRTSIRVARRTARACRRARPASRRGKASGRAPLAPRPTESATMYTRLSTGTDSGTAGLGRHRRLGGAERHCTDGDGGRDRDRASGRRSRTPHSLGDHVHPPAGGVEQRVGHGRCRDAQPAVGADADRQGVGEHEPRIGVHARRLGPSAAAVGGQERAGHRRDDRQRARDRLGTRPGRRDCRSSDRGRGSAPTHPRRYGCRSSATARPARTSALRRP